jgi:hypothetical protein
LPPFDSPTFIVVAIAPIRRREQGNFFTPTGNNLDKPERLTGRRAFAVVIAFGLISGATMRFAY